MRPSRLVLRREVLAELSPVELARVAGARQSGQACSIMEHCPSGHAACSLLCPQSWHTEEC